MNTQTQKLFIVCMLLVTTLSTAHAQQQVTVFNKTVTLHSTLKTREMANGYPLSVGASHIRYTTAWGLNASELQELFDAVIPLIGSGSIPKGQPVLGGFFTTQYDNDTFKVSKNYTHGFSFAFHKDTVLTLYHYELNAHGKFELVNNLTTRINSYSEELFLMLHYSHFDPLSFPAKSTIFSFVCDTLGKVRYFDSSDVQVALSKDYKRQIGLYPLGMADSSVIVSLGYPNAGDIWCNGPCNYQTPNSTCLVITDEMSTAYSCIANPTCAAGAIERQARQDNIDLGVAVKFKKMRDFRDLFMSQYCEGRKYTGFYYTFSKYVKLNPAMLWKYASVLPEIYEAMDNLFDDASDKIIITASLKSKVLEILDAHRDVGDAYFQSILSEVESDLERFEGMEKSVLLALLSPYGSCGQHRYAEDGMTGNQDPFASVFFDPSTVQLVVNYFIPGGDVRFDLFNASSGLVGTLSGSESRKKLILSAIGMQSGIYLYRVRSASGYEKVGKVAVVK